jgi:hypothetical protein
MRLRLGGTGTGLTEDGRSITMAAVGAELWVGPPGRTKVGLKLQGFVKNCGRRREKCDRQMS